MKMGIVERLRDTDARGVAPPQNWTTEAADEIDRLRAKLEAFILANEAQNEMAHNLRAEVAELRKDAESAFTLLATMFDAYEDGDECYEDPEDRAGYCGKAIKLDEADFYAIVNLLNKHRPRITIAAAPSPQEEK